MPAILLWSRSMRRQCTRIICATLLLSVLIIFLSGWHQQDHILKEMQPKKEVKVYVVEEHHEALQYWYQEAMTENIPRSGNTLIHIDAHADLAPAAFIKNYPFFEWPRNEQQVESMIQSNDMFIQAAMSIGLIDHLIWIYPSWDTTLGPDYEALRLDIGYATNLPEIKKKNTKVSCECRVEVIKGDPPKEEKECMALVIKNGNEEHVEIKPEKCIVMKSVPVEKIVDQTALDVLRKKAWMKKPQSIILDVDEDYFGCGSGFKGIVDGGATVETIFSISDMLAELICANNTQQEEAANKMLKDYVVEFIKLCELKEASRRCTKDRQHLRIVLDKHIMKSFDEAPSMYCDDSVADAMDTMADILKLLKRFSYKSLEALLQLGFCFYTTPASVEFKKEGPRFSICHGNNMPNETIVNLHMPDLSEIKGRMSDLHKMFDHMMGLDLRMVTLCRSVRDGYTPRQFANQIEDGILSHFQRTDNKRPFRFDVVYDSNLLGGQKGWDGRYNPDCCNLQNSKFVANEDV